MKIDKILISNYRLLKRFNLDVAENLSLVLGKNNTGKTSFLHVLQKFLNTNANNFNFEDFSLDYQKEILSAVITPLDKENYTPYFLELKIIITYEDDDNLANISDLILDLDAKNNELELSFQYTLDFSHYEKLIEDYKNYQLGNDLIEFLKKHHSSYFKIKKNVVDNNDPTNSIEIEDSKIKKIINLQTIAAKRDVVNEDGDGAKSNNTLSKLSYKYYKPQSSSNESHVINLKKELIDTDKKLTKNYESIFAAIVKDVKKFSTNSSEIKVRSSFEEVSLLRENTSVVYEEKGHLLPEDYNGLGYMNLFSMIFELHILFENFKKSYDESEPAEINLLFIEEPEAHTHPQMQYVFIKNIKEFIAEKTEDLALHTIITTHSAHIASQSEFTDVKYFICKKGEVHAKNLSGLEKQYGTDAEAKRNFKFLKQYLTLNRAELFFADKVVLIEGDTERILLPAMMRKLDLENSSVEGYTPLLSQNISIVEVGAHSKVFEHFLDFIEIKTLIITDVDYSKKEERGENKDGSKKIKDVTSTPEEAEGTTNSTLNHFFKKPTADALKSFKDDDFSTKLPNSLTPIYIAFQGKENGKYVRSFEDAFLSNNLPFVKDKKDEFSSLKNRDRLNDSKLTPFEIANECIGKKTEFATEILYHSDEIFSEWKTPNYINKGLLWLGQE